MKTEIENLMDSILHAWNSDDPNARLGALELIEAATTQRVELPQEPVVEILRAAMYEDFRPYPQEIWIEGLAVAEKACKRWNWDFALFSPLVDGTQM